MLRVSRIMMIKGRIPNSPVPVVRVTVVIHVPKVTMASTVHLGGVASKCPFRV